MGKTEGRKGNWGTAGSGGFEQVRGRTRSLTIGDLVLDTGLSSPSSSALRVKVLIIQLRPLFTG